jgi:hypothetical protein
MGYDDEPANWCRRKVTHLVVISVIDGGLTKGALVIKD